MIKTKYILIAFVFFSDIVPDLLLEDSQIFSHVSVLVLPTFIAVTASSVLPRVKLVLHFLETYLQLSHDYSCNLVIYVHYQCLLEKK